MLRFSRNKQKGRHGPVFLSSSGAEQRYRRWQGRRTRRARWVALVLVLPRVTWKVER